MATTPMVPTAGIPNPESFEQLDSDMLSTYASLVGISDFNVGSAVTSFFETVALTTARAAGSVFQILRDFSIDRATGDALQNLAIENGVTPIVAAPASGAVNVIDTSFQVISTQIYAGANPPNIGSVMISVSDASQFPATGSIYIGRGTPNIEGPLPYTSITSSGGFFIINLSSPTTKFHNLGESVILSQGGVRTIPANTIVVSPALGSNPAIQFSTNAAAVILDGATTVNGVQVTALTPGSSGNVPAGAVNQFASLPFSGATVINPLAFTTGLDTETDDQLRVRIKNAIASTGLGTATAVEAACIGATATDPVTGQSSTIVSDNLALVSYGAILYVDNGAGYEATSQGVGIESIVDSAIGGEQFFQLATGGSQAPVAKAFLQTTIAAPFDLIGGDTLAVTVGETTYQHVFANSDFVSPGGASAYEITASINADTTLGFQATTAGGGQFVVIRSNTEGADSIQTVIPTTNGRNAATLMGFPSNEVQTLRLYKNNIPLSKDGFEATVTTQPQTFWSASITDGDTLILSVDGTASITYTITDADFLATGLYSSVSPTNSLASWQQVFLNLLTGVTTTVVGNQLEITSNLGTSNRARVVIDPSSTLVLKGMFSTVEGLSSQGKTSDFTLSRNTAQFELAVPLVAGDQLSAGSTQTEARISSLDIPGGSVTLTAEGYFWLLVDNPGILIPTGVVSNTVLIVSASTPNIISYFTPSNPNSFVNVLVGDYVIIWSAELNAANRIEGRVFSVTPDTLNIEVTAAEYAAANAVDFPTPETVTFVDGFVVLRTSLAPQKFSIPIGTSSLDQIAAGLNAQTNEVTFSVLKEEFLIAQSNTTDTHGALLFVTADTEGKELMWPIGTSAVSEPSLIAFRDSTSQQADFPLFVQSTFAAGSFANPPDSYLGVVFPSISFVGRDPNELIAFLNPYGIDNVLTTTGNIAQNSNQITSLASVTGLSLGFTVVGAGIPQGTTIIDIVGNTITMSSLATATATAESISFNSPAGDEQPAGENVQVASIIDASTVDIWPHQPIIRRVRQNDRFFIANPLDFGNNDTLVVVLDNNPSTETFEIPFFRLATANNTLASSSTNWNAYDTESGATAEFGTPTWVDFDFSNFKALMQAKNVLNTSVPATAILYRATRWGRTGQFIKISYVYPSVPESQIGSVVVVNEDINIMISPASGPAIPTSIDSSTEWNVTITPHTPTSGVDQVTYTWSGVGTAPALTLSGGEYVNITNQTDFASENIGIFRVSTQAGFLPTSTSFSVQRPTGVAVPQTDIATNTIGAITFYDAVPTTATQVAAYVNANLTDITAVTVNGGSGIIVFSTAEDSGFTASSIQLLDGINWIQTSNPYPATPQFVFKVPLALPATTGYAFNSNAYGTGSGGEEVILVPTTQDQVARLISVLAVSGFTTLGKVSLVERASRLELETLTVGSAGAVQVIGGFANGYQTPILDSSINLDNSFMISSVNNVAGAGIHSDQWFRLQAATPQAKDTLIGSNTVITLAGNQPTTGQTTVTLGDRLLTQRYFGKPRHYIRPTGDTFRVELQGSLVCLSWTGVGPQNPQFTFPLNFNDSGGGTINIAPVIDTDDVQYIIESGNANFTELSIGDLLTISGFVAPNNGTFLVSGVSQDGKTVQVSNVAAQPQYSSGTFTFTGNANSGDVFSVNGTNLVAGSPQLPIGVTMQDTAANLAAAIGSIAGVTAVASGSVVTVTATVPSASIAISYTPFTTSEVVVSGAQLMGIPFTTGQFSAVSQVSEGDTMIVGSPFNVLNQGQFRIIRLYIDPISLRPSVWFENADAVNEEVELPSNTVNLSYDSTTQFNVTTSNNDIFLEWNGTGTEPTLGNAQIGDIVTFGSGFATDNQGSFMVINSSAKMQQIEQLTMPAYSAFALSGAGQYFLINSAGNVVQYYVWFQTGANTDPAPLGLTGIMVAITSGFTSSQVAIATRNALNGAAGTPFIAVASNNIVTVITSGFIETTPATNNNVPSPFSIVLLQSGNRTYLEAINPEAVPQSGISGVVLLDNRPQIRFFEYEATVPNDVVVISSNLLGASNQGTYTILQVLNQNTAIISGSLASVFEASLSGNVGAVAVNEGTPYSGYKHVVFVASEPGSTTQNYVVFDTYQQYEKIDQSASVEMSSLGKEEFLTTLENGLDSYRFNTGLIRAANKIIYGDPTDSQTYPGVGAAGAEIFVQEPLTLRIQVSVDVRLKTGVAFSQMVTQVRSSVGSLINSNPVGESIAISAIVSAVQAIPGVISVAISSPLYDATNDLIPLDPSEKALIIDPTTDVLVNQIGTT